MIVIQLRYSIFVDNNDELSYLYCLFTAVGLSEGSSEAVLRTATRTKMRGDTYCRVLTFKSQGVRVSKSLSKSLFNFISGTYAIITLFDLELRAS